MRDDPHSSNLKLLELQTQTTELLGIVEKKEVMLLTQHYKNPFYINVGWPMLPNSGFIKIQLEIWLLFLFLFYFLHLFDLRYMETE